MPDTREYNPLDYENLTINLVRELMSRDAGPLPPLERFYGAGVYALFYDGDFSPYQHPRIRSSDSTWPIYVGKAVPAGARTGTASGARSTGRQLYSRLGQHAKSISTAENLALGDFRCRFLVVTPLWITMAERFLIENFQPIWNVCVAGFGIHDPGAGRHEGQVSWWDTLHPGRKWGPSLRQARTAADVEARLRNFLALQDTEPDAARREASQVADETDDSRD